MNRMLVGLGMAVVLFSAGLSRAEGVNCKQVNKYLQTGRSTKDVSETMVIDEAEVKKCQAEAAANPPAGGGTAPAGGEEKK